LNSKVQTAEKGNSKPDARAIQSDREKRGEVEKIGPKPKFQPRGQIKKEIDKENEINKMKKGS